MTYSVIIHEAVGCGAGFWAEVEQLPGCYAFSDNLGRLAEDVTQAIEAHVSKLQQAGKPIPEGQENAQQESGLWRIAVPV
ncbi:MAG TPA: type II toxin-antitoxin system HicB family antitoxin [Dehalococcoidia bacterium]|nr:type II toxin-antitoxin system HicB family antitoxin [Dehalococcoidia bacterium]